MFPEGNVQSLIVCLPNGNCPKSLSYRYIFKFSVKLTPHNLAFPLEVVVPPLAPTGHLLLLLAQNLLCLPVLVNPPH